MEFTIAEMWAKSGVIAKSVVVILGIMSIFVIAVSVERLIVFFKAKKQSREYALLIQELLKNHQYKEAADAAQQFGFSHIAKVIRSGLMEFIKGNLIAPSCGTAPKEGGYDVIGAVNRAIEKAGAREMAGMRRGLAGLATVGSTAPFVGLFGTVFGIINSFQGMAKEGAGGIGAVSAGIAEALITTAVGIGVAIIAVLLYNYFTSQVDGLQVDTNESAVEILDLIVKSSGGPKAAS
jgi:biopolymer transport protein ExbB